MLESVTRQACTTPSRTALQSPSRTTQQTPSRAALQSPSRPTLQTPSRTTLQTPSRTTQQTPTQSQSQQRRTPRSTARPIVPREEECWPVTTLLDKYPELRFERWLPSTLRSIERSSGAVFDERLLRGPKGNTLCLWCGSECKSSSALFCNAVRARSRFGEGCEHEHRMRRDGQYVRRQLFLRDGGACAKCGIDTHELFTRAIACRTLEQRRAMFKQLARQTSPHWYSKTKRPLESMEYDFTGGMMWEAAHVIDVRHGGGLCGLDGFRTLCTPCHSEEYVRSYAQELCEMPLYQSPPRAATPQSPTARSRRPANVLSSRNTNVARSAQRAPAKDCTPLILLDSSPSSTSSSPRLPSPNLVVCQPPRTANAETPTKQRARGGRKTPASLRCKAAGSPSVLSPSKTPVRRLAAIIDLTGPPSLIIPGHADSELEILTSKVTTFNISSSEESADEGEVVIVASNRTTQLPMVNATPTPAVSARPRAKSASRPRPGSRTGSRARSASASATEQPQISTATAQASNTTTPTSNIPHAATTPST
ncbi:hypothetical protein GGF43_003262 [Coemansia sp. RSA 2618]|nr:hypothetical protein GGF43_003262 [Coemansia sp. RSA 2618]